MKLLLAIALLTWPVVGWAQGAEGFEGCRIEGNSIICPDGHLPVIGCDHICGPEFDALEKRVKALEKWHTKDGVMLPECPDDTDISYGLVPNAQGLAGMCWYDRDDPKWTVVDTFTFMEKD